MGAARVESERYGTGEAAGDCRPGDFLLTHRSGVIPRLIRLGERRRYGAGAQWSHCALVVAGDGTLVEAETRGVSRSPLEKYRPREYTVVRTSRLLSPEGAGAATAYAERQVGQAFGFLVMFSVAVWLATGIRLELRRRDHQICSGLVARALQEGGLDVGGDPTFMLPADLADRFLGYTDARGPRRRT
ncbi:MAG TPA: hypothetical protein VF134_01555 [Candidatus Dormibacteraeota bacterium]